MNTKQIFILAALIVLISCEPTPPIWADQWYQDFTDKWDFDGELVITTGFYAYDWTNNKQNQYREDCRVDSVSRDIFNESTPCSQIVNQGNRYVYFQEKDYCCFCCDAAHGCALLKPDWISLAGEEFMGTKQINGQLYNVFRNFDDVNPVYTLYNAKTDIQSFIYRPGNGQFMKFDQNSYTTHLNPSVVEFPQTCQAKDLPQCQGTCGELRSINKDSQQIKE